MQRPERQRHPLSPLQFQVLQVDAAVGGEREHEAGDDGGVTEPVPAPVVEIELPSVDEPVEQMQEEEQEIREEFGNVTISGKSAQATH